MSCRRFVVFIGLVLSLVAAGCEKSPRLSPLATDAVILAFGDSLTYGSGADPEESYPAILSRQLQRKVINAGIPGETSAQGLARLPDLLETYQPQLIIICYGGNDFLRRLDRGRLVENLRKMVVLSRDFDAEVVLIGVPQLGLLLSTDPLYASLAEELKLPYEGEVLEELLSDRQLKSDRIHPNARGYEIMAQRIAEVLRAAGAI